jgi:hypothetical protein
VHSLTEPVLPTAPLLPLQTTAVDKYFSVAKNLPNKSFYNQTGAGACVLVCGARRHLQCLRLAGFTGPSVRSPPPALLHLLHLHTLRTLCTLCTLCALRTLRPLLVRSRNCRLSRRGCRRRGLRHRVRNPARSPAPRPRCLRWVPVRKFHYGTCGRCQALSRCDFACSIVQI